MSQNKHPHRKVILIMLAVLVGILIILSFTVIGTGSVENGMAAVKPHPVPPPPPAISLTPPPTDPAPSDNPSGITDPEGDVEDDDSPAPPDLVAAAPDVQPAVPAATPTAPAAPAQAAAQAPAQPQTTTPSTAATPVAAPKQEVKPPPAKPVTVPVVTQAAPVPPPPPCLNHSDWSAPQPGWRRASDGNCYEIPKLDLALSGPASVNAPGGNATFTVTIVNNGSNLASAVLYKQQLDANGNLTLVDLKASQGDPYGKEDDRTFVCSIGTIMPGQSATVTISLKATGSGSVTIGVVEPGGEEDTNTDDNHLSTHVVLTTPQTQLSVQQHGLQWGGHYYGSVQVFARVLAREGATWRGWKQNHQDLARGLVAHDASSRR